MRLEDRGSVHKSSQALLLERDKLFLDNDALVAQRQLGRMQSNRKSIGRELTSSLFFLLDSGRKLSYYKSNKELRFLIHLPTFPGP